MVEQATLFGGIDVTVPTTEGVKYTGSKLKLLPHILRLAKRTQAKTVFDGFSGTTRVSQAFAKSGYRVLSNDIAVWSKVFGTCYLMNEKPASAYQKLIDHLNALSPVDGWFTEHYGGLPNGGCAIQADGLKKPWQIHNTRKLDAIREEIDRLGLSEVEKAVALTSLILAMDKVDSTLGHFVSYLKDWSPRSSNLITLKVPEVFIRHDKHEVFQRDTIGLAPDICADLAYYDPPYGSNNEKMPPSRVRYASYYHLWTTVCLNDKPRLFGKAKRRIDTSDVASASIFEEFRRNGDGRFVVVEAIERLIKSTNAKWIILSYSSGGRATAKELNDVLSDNGIIYDIVELDYKRNVMAGMKWTNQWIRDAQEPNREFLFLLQTW